MYIKYSTASNKLDPSFVTGFCDAESCFQILIIKNPKFILGWSVRLVFSIHLHAKDVGILYKLKEFFGVGNVTINGITAYFQVVAKKDLIKVINHFISYPLKSKKLIDFLLFKKAHDLILNNYHLNNLQILVNIKASINKGLSPLLAQAFPNTIPEAIPQITLNYSLLNMKYWLAGFVTGEGCFFVKISKSKTHRLGCSVGLNFILVQNIRNIVLLEEIKLLIGCGSITINNTSIVRLSVSKFSDIQNIIIPLFNEFEILGSKSKDFEDFKKISTLINNKEHLTSEGLAKILSIKSSMNFNRK